MSKETSVPYKIKYLTCHIINEFFMYGKTITILEIGFFEISSSLWQLSKTKDIFNKNDWNFNTNFLGFSLLDVSHGLFLNFTYFDF